MTCEGVRRRQVVPVFVVVEDLGVPSPILILKGAKLVRFDASVFSQRCRTDKRKVWQQAEFRHGSALKETGKLARLSRIAVRVSSLSRPSSTGGLDWFKKYDLLFKPARLQPRNNIRRCQASYKALVYIKLRTLPCGPISAFSFLSPFHPRVRAYIPHSESSTRAIRLVSRIQRRKV